MDTSRTGPGSLSSRRNNSTFLLVDKLLRVVPMKKARRPFALAFILILSIQTLHGGSATWSANAVSGDWNTAPNWIPPVVPNSAQSSATFAVSTTTGISISANTQVSTIAFNAGASNFTITANPGLSLTIGGGGITNNSGVTQN